MKPLDDLALLGENERLRARNAVLEKVLEAAEAIVRHGQIALAWRSARRHELESALADAIAAAKEKP
jgi:hypothetical protein